MLLGLLFMKINEMPNAKVEIKTLNLENNGICRIGIGENKYRRNGGKCPGYNGK